jgi:hypothetical protein
MGFLWKTVVDRFELYPAREKTSSQAVCLLVNCRRSGIRSLPPQVGIEKTIEVAVENALEISDVMTGSLILHPLVWMQKIVANL